MADDLSDLAAGDQVAELDPLRMPSIHERLHQLDLFVGTHLDDPARFGSVESEGFFAQNVLARRGPPPWSRGMEMVGERVVDGVDVRVLEQFLVDCHRRAGSPVEEAGLLGAVEPAGGDRHQVAVRGTLQGRDHPLPPDLGCAQHSPSDLARSCASSMEWLAHSGRMTCGAPLRTSTAYASGRDYWGGSTASVEPTIPEKRTSRVPTVQIAPATGRLGVLTPGMGAVATTLFAGVLAARKGQATPIGSLTQMGHIRLGKRTDGSITADPGVCALSPISMTSCSEVGIPTRTTPTWPRMKAGRAPARTTSRASARSSGSSSR